MCQLTDFYAEVWTFGGGVTGVRAQYFLNNYK